MKATEILKTDHQNLLKLIDQLKTTAEGGERDAIALQRVYDSLIVHTRCEEQIFYPAMRSIDEGEVQTSIEAHQEIDDLLEELVAIRIQKGIDLFLNLLNQLEQKTRSHIQEEEARLIPEAEDRLKGKLEELGNQIEWLKVDLRTTQFGMAA